MKFIGPIVFIACLASNTLASEAPKLKLDHAVEPVRYAVDLILLPDATEFSGAVEIDVRLQRPTELIWLNSSNITIGSAYVIRAGRTLTASLEPGNENFIGLKFSSALPAGTAKIRLQYEGKISLKDSAGIFRGKDGEDSYLFTQFEETDARHAFPCFDQPDFKTPWQVTLHVKKDHTAISNTPQVSETAEASGMKRVVFAPTKPLPSYLVAFAVGPFDIVDAGRTGRNGVPVRIVTPKGKAGQAKYAAEVTGPIIARLEQYFGIPFPYDKADQVAIPLAFGFGAMENAGMVTYSSTVLLSDPVLDSPQRQRTYASIAAHELAHQWFGDLVTLAWWDDTWLNEAFATWTAAKIITEWKPEWNWRLSDLGAKFRAISQDSLVSTRKIRQPIEAMDDISNAFDEITYEKGAAVIRMFEMWVGEKQFQTGVNSYLNRYANRNATVNDFLDAISAAGRPRLKQAFSTFLEQPGVPMISVDLKCEGEPSLALAQKRYLPSGSTGSKDQIWQTPVCVRYQTDHGPQKECFLLDRASADFRLTKAAGCPALVSANDGGSGYYIAAYSPALLRKLLDSGSGFLDAAERRTVLYDLKALVAEGDAKAGQMLESVFPFAKAPERAVVAEAQNAANAIRRLVPPDLLPNYARYIRRAFGERAAALGWSPKPADDEDTRLLRASLVPFVATAGNDKALQAEARRLADAWLKDRKGIEPGMIPSVLKTAALAGDRALWETMLAELKKTQDLQLRSSIILALGSFRDPTLVEAAANLVMQPDLDIKESFDVLFAPLEIPETQHVPFEFVKKNYDALIQRVPTGGGSDAAALLPFTGSPGCDAAARKEFVDFFEERAKKALGGPRNYAQALEGITLCIAQKTAQGANVAEFLRGQ